jgi:hypothetical protein
VSFGRQYTMTFQRYCRPRYRGRTYMVLGLSTRNFRMVVLIIRSLTLGLCGFYVRSELFVWT